MEKWARVIALVLAMAATVAVAGDEMVERPAWIGRTLEALETHLERHPEAEAADVYKLLHQAVMGPGHAIPDRERAAGWLGEELAGLDPAGPVEPLCESLGGAPAMVRIHLRPFLAAGGDRDRLLEAFVATANDVEPRPERLGTLLEAASGLLVATARRDLADSLARLVSDLGQEGFPAVHHSEVFEATYRPAYRVVARDRARAEGWCS